MTDFDKIPENYKYTRNHEWALEDDSGDVDIYIVGITDHMHKKLLVILFMLNYHQLAQNSKKAMK